MCNHDIHEREIPLARKASRMGMLIQRYYQVNSPHRDGAGSPLRGQGRVLALLAAKPQTTQRELSYVLDMRQQSLSELLAKLEERGYITREKSAEDGRVSTITLTAAGAAAAPSLDDLEAMPDALEVLSDEERVQFEALVDKVNESLKAKLDEMGVDLVRPHHPHGPQGGHGMRGPRPEGEHGHGMRGPRPEGEHGHGMRGPRPEGEHGHGMRGPKPEGEHGHGMRGPKPEGEREHRGGAGFDHHGMRQA